MRQHAARPFTLIELIVVMGVMIIIASIAVPAYSSLFSGRKTTLAANKLNGAVMEARAHAVTSKQYSALIFGRDGKGYTNFRLAEVYYSPSKNTYAWRRWVPGTSIVLLPENTMIPTGSENIGTTVKGASGNMGSADLPEVTLSKSGMTETEAPAIIFKPNGQLAGTREKNVVVRFVETNRYEVNRSMAPKLPLNINWLTCKTKFLAPVQ